MNPITKETLDLMKGALANPDDQLAKTISTATGLLAYDLQAPAKNLYPFVTPIRNVMPRVGGGVGTGTNWRQALDGLLRAVAGLRFLRLGDLPQRCLFSVAGPMPVAAVAHGIKARLVLSG